MWCKYCRFWFKIRSKHRNVVGTCQLDGMVTNAGGSCPRHEDRAKADAAYEGER